MKCPNGEHANIIVDAKADGTPDKAQCGFCGADVTVIECSCGRKIIRFTFAGPRYEWFHLGNDGIPRPQQPACKVADAFCPQDEGRTHEW